MDSSVYVGPYFECIARFVSDRHVVDRGCKKCLTHKNRSYASINQSLTEITESNVYDNFFSWCGSKIK
jgi:hypothetical protein